VAVRALLPRGVQSKVSDANYLSLLVLWPTLMLVVHHCYSMIYPFFSSPSSQRWCDNSWPRYPTCPVCREHDASPIVTCAEPNLPVHQLVERIVRQQRAPFVVDVHW